MSLAEIHGRLANAVVLYTVIVGVWGFYNFVRKQKVSEGYWGALVIAELLILTQGTLGGVLWYQGHALRRGVHLLYGLTTALVIPAVYVFTRGREERAENLAYGSATLLAAVLAIRAIVTA
jgi:hypothetical protein